MNFKKSLVSLAAVMALSGVSSADTATKYIHLTSKTHDGAWVMFGVNGFSSGIPSVIGKTAAAGFSENFSDIEEERVDDDQETEGLFVGGKPLASVEVIDNDAGLITTLSVGVDITDVPYEAKEPVRTIYVKFQPNGKPLVKFNYKASLEGKVLEIKYNDVMYKLAALDQKNTYDNAALAVERVDDSAEDQEAQGLSKIVDVVDFDLKDNPTEPKYYSKASHLDTTNDLSAKAKTAQFYHFDAVSQQWKIWNINYEGNANDFTEFSKGDAYWGRIDVDDKITELQNDGAQGEVDGSDGTNIIGSGLILGRSLTPNKYLKDDNSSKLAPGWNHLAFDDSQAYIRHAATGLIFEKDANKTIDITDASGLFTITTSKIDNTKAGAIVLNRDIELSKVKGDLPKSVNIKAFYAGDDKFVLLSDSKFTLAEGDGANHAEITNVKTLTGSKPYGERGYNDTTLDALDAGTEDKKSATSVYGEYAIIADLMVIEMVSDNEKDGTSADAGEVAASLDKLEDGNGDKVSAQITFGTLEKDYKSIALTDDEDNEPDANLTKHNIEGLALFDGTDGTGLVTAIDFHHIDLDGDGNDDVANDAILIANTKPFYIKDSTYTRVFEYSDLPADGEAKFTVNGGITTTEITPSDEDNDTKGAETTAAKILDQADANASTGVYANSVGTKIIAVSTESSTFDLKDLESGTKGFLINTTSTDNLAMGAIKGVYAIDTVARTSLVPNQLVATGFMIPDDPDENATIIVDVGDTDDDNATIEVDLNATSPKLSDDSTDTAGRLDLFNKIVEAINKQFKADELHAYAYHDYKKSDDNLGTAKIYMVGLEAKLLKTETGGNVDMPSQDFIEMNDGNSSVSYRDLNSSIGTPASLITDLKTNAVYTPNYPDYGPLYTLREAGYEARAMLKATTEFVDQNITWDSVDLTRDEQDLFRNNEFNLFSVDGDSGYWVYLEDAPANDIVIKDASFTPTYTYYFDNKNDSGEFPTTNIINGGLFSVSVTGLDKSETSTATVYANVGGEKVQLKATPGSDNYTANFDRYAMKSFKEGNAISIAVRATNGKGIAKNMTTDYAFDYKKQKLLDPVAIDSTTIKFSIDANETASFKVYKEYIQELASKRNNANTSTAVASYPLTSGTTSQNICERLTFGDVDTLRVIAIDGNGEMGQANISDAKEFIYATMNKGAMILTHLGGSDDDKAIIGVRYNDSCVQSNPQPTEPSDNTGVSVKALVDDATVILSYKEIPGVGSDLSNAWVTTYAVDGSKVVQTQNLEEYAGKTIFIEYDGKLYKSKFPDSSADAEATDDDPIELGDENNTQILPVNNTLAP